MPGRFFRAVALLLVPCLLAEPISARKALFREQALALQVVNGSQRLRIKGPFIQKLLRGFCQSIKQPMARGLRWTGVGGLLFEWSLGKIAPRTTQVPEAALEEPTRIVRVRWPVVSLSYRLSTKMVNERP